MPDYIVEKWINLEDYKDEASAISHFGGQLGYMWSCANYAGHVYRVERIEVRREGNRFAVKIEMNNA
jgi:hypothetical protein